MGHTTKTESSINITHFHVPKNEGYKLTKQFKEKQVYRKSLPTIFRKIVVVKY